LARHGGYGTLIEAACAIQFAHFCHNEIDNLIHAIIISIKLFITAHRKHWVKLLTTRQPSGDRRMNLNQLKLSSKLGMAFAVLILLTLVVGSLGIVQMARINDNTTDIAANRLPSIRTLAAVRAAANQIRRAEPDHLLSLSDAEMDDIDKRLASGKDELTKQEAAYAGLIATPEERTLFEEMQKARGAFLATQPKLLELSRGGEKTFDQAKAYFRGESRQAYNAYSESIQRAIDYNDKGSEVSYATAQAVYAQARGWAIGLMATSVLLAVALALLLLRNVNRQLGSDPQEAAALARRVAQGDLGSHITLCRTAWPRWLPPCARAASPWPRPALRSPRATPISLPAPNSRPARWKKPPPPWKSWAPPCARTPTTPAPPTSWP
jgi:CHASE3 domain sensor protein